MRKYLAVLAVTSLLAVLALPILADGGVLSPDAAPLGWTRADMTGALALFTTSGNDKTYYPDTPFQILYAKKGDTSGTLAPDGGWAVTGTSVFNAVTPDTYFFVPHWNCDDSPPILGTWPTNLAQAQTYFYSPGQIGAQGMQIIVDGVVTDLGPAYVAGPVYVATPLLDGGGHNMVTIGAFLAPMSVGTHTVVIRGRIAGRAVEPVVGVPYMSEDLTYIVKVTPKK